MPIIASSYSKPPFYLFNRHLETIVPSMLRKIDGVYERERLELPDGDFLDLDWMKGKSEKLVIISHGLEGNSERHYSKGVAHCFHQRGWDALAWNCRGCSGEMNRLPRFYHHGATEDIAAVIDHAIQKKYSHIVLVGISMGGSMTLKYVGERKDHLPSPVKSVATFSVPCDLASSARELDKPNKKFYLNRFLKKLEKKIREKSAKFPDQISVSDFEKIKTFRDFDNRYTAPLHGFTDADDFYNKASCRTYISDIKIPALIVNALNDPFLPEDCFPFDIAKTHSHIYLETPTRGGHVGFSMAGRAENWIEVRSFEFVNSFLT